MKRVRLIHVCLTALFSMAILLSGAQELYAQVARSSVASGSAQLTRRSTAPFNSKGSLPAGTTRRVAPWEAKGRSTSSSIVQTMDLTANTPLITDRNPFWSMSDENVVLFESDRVANSDYTYSKGSAFHIWRMTKAGGSLIALTGPDASVANGGIVTAAGISQTEPALNQLGSTMVYVETQNGVSTINELTLRNGTSKSLLLGAHFEGETTTPNFTAISHPQYGPIPAGLATDPKASGIGVIFTAKRDSHDYYTLYAVDTGSGRLVELSPGAISDDRNPTVNPNTQMIAFDSNRSNALGSATKGNRDIWVITVNQRNPSAQRVTNSGTSNNIEPVWTSTVEDTQGYLGGNQYLFFASTRKSTGGVASTHDIYFLNVFITSVTGNFSIFNTENDGNSALKLNTSDPTFIYDDRRPAVSLFSTGYRVIYSSDRTYFNPAGGTDPNAPGDSGPAGTPSDIFASTLIDLNAPTLIRYDNENIVNVSPRVANPGGSVKIRVKVADLESGMPHNDPTFRDGVWVQVKNPNSKYQSADGLEHKLFYAANEWADGSQGNMIHNVPNEWEFEPIFIGTDPTDPRFNTYALPKATYPAAWTEAPPSTLPYTSVGNRQDTYAFSGQSHAPVKNGVGVSIDTGWMPLARVDGSFDSSDGSWIYEGTWTTPSVPSDYIMDVICYDAARNPFSFGNNDSSHNWIIYDNVWGFTTQAFQPKNHILFVSDYAKGQRFMTESDRVGVNDTNRNYVGSESWLTDFSLRIRPNEVWYGTATPVPIHSNWNIWNTLGVGSYSDSWSNGTNGVPSTTGYDLWRIICRGPITSDVLGNYQKHTITQPGDPLVANSTAATVPVYNGCVFWHSPLTGALWTGPGTIADLAVQGLLHSFIAGGNHLFINGQDIAWDLTLNGNITNSFLTSDLKATFSADDIGYTMTAAGSPNPITYDPWPNFSHNSYYGSTVYGNTHNTISASTRYFINWNAWNGESYAYRDLACREVTNRDGVTPAAGAVADMYVSATQVGLMHYIDAATGAKVVYCSAGIEGMVDDIWSQPVPVGSQSNFFLFANRKAELFHNMACWMLTGSIYGQVVDRNGNVPVPGVFVRLTNGATVNYTAVTDSDGKYVFEGVSPGYYNIIATKTGYATHRGLGGVVHGGDKMAIAGIQLNVAEPSEIRGKVTAPDGVTPMAGVKLIASDNSDITGKTLFTTTTDVNGAYDLQRIASGTTYKLIVDTTAGGSSVPLSYTVPDPNDATRSNGDQYVAPSKVYAGYDFILKQTAGTITGTVVSSAGQALIAGATVSLQPVGSVTPAITDGAGAYTLVGVDPGTVSLVASAPGFRSNTASPVSVTVVSAQSVVADPIVLTPAQPGSVSGLVVDMNQAPLAGATVNIMHNGQVVATGVTSANILTDTAGNQYNFKITAQSGVTYTVTATYSGYTPTPANRTGVVVTENTDSPRVNFEMDPLHTFSRQTSLVSAPYDYSAYLAADLLLPIGYSSSDVRNFLFATWTGSSYAYYRATPADTFIPGRGYFVGFTTNMALRTTGSQQSVEVPFNIELRKGWNLIGDPFGYDAQNNPVVIDYTNTSILVNGTPYTYANAVLSGLISSSLYTYTAGTYVLDYNLTPWVGYWIRSYADCTLVLNPATARISRSKSLVPVSRAALGGSTGWSVNLQVKVGGVGDNASVLGATTRASNGFDQYKVEKAPLFGNQYAYLTFNHSDWGDKSGAYGVDVRSSATANSNWNFTVKTNVPNTTATISWPNVATVDRNVQLTLTDIASGEVRDLRTNSSYSWQTATGESTRQFKIEATHTGRGGLLISGLTARSTSRSVSGSSNGSVNVSYNINVAANVDVRIISGAGKVVRTITGRSGRAAGINQLTWDQKSENGAYVAAGTYLVEVRAQSVDGKQNVKAVTPFVITR